MNDEPMGQVINQILGSSEALAGLDIAQSEDCLFLDIQIPEKAIKNPSLKLPVVVYVYGGGYALGSKDLLEPLLPLYDGSGLIEQSGNNIIFVSFNYRVGALGFLAGTTMERDGLPNAGLWDQRAVFQWVQTHISKLGGDPKQVTALGESAGASSLLFHLVAEGGTLDPLFRRAILLSPAYQPMWDRAGSIEDQFLRFASLADCEGKGLKCLRAADTKALNKANVELVKQQAPGTFAVGPTPDGSFIRQIPTAELSLGRIWPIESIVLSHCEKEAVLFVSGAVKTNEQFEDFLSVLLPNSSISNGITERVLEAYPPIGNKGSLYKKQSDRLEALIRDSSMTCSIRYITEALGADKVWNMQYGVAPGWHATDLIPVFYNDKDFDMSSFTDFLASALSLITGLFMGALSRAYQSYLTSYIRTGDPNTYRISRWQNKLFPGTEQWRRPELTSEGMKKVLNVDYGLLKYFSEVHDKQFPQDKCDFWKEFAKAGTVAGGYVPEGEVL
ncbi:alpha/beta-hydrolase, partial [Sarocladium strictum]